MKIKVADLTGAALDFAVAEADGHRIIRACTSVDFRGYAVLRSSLGIRERIGIEYAPSTEWAQGGPILDREKLSLDPPSAKERIVEVGVMERIAYWRADSQDGHFTIGLTALIAAMRCFVASKLGDEVDVPDVLLDKVLAS